MSVVASKKVGSSVLRNRAKRLLREAFRAASVINSASLTSLMSLKDAPNLADKSVAGNYETEARLMSVADERNSLNLSLETAASLASVQNEKKAAKVQNTVSATNLANLKSAQKARGLLCGYYALIAKNELLSLEFGQILKDLKWSLKKLNCQVL